MKTDIAVHEPALPALPEQVLPAITELVVALGIPRELLASDEEVRYAWRDLPRELKNIPAELRGELIARMCVAVSAGLFDGAMNYAWNASILNLRQKVRHFGLPVVAQILQGDFEERHLSELQDSRLLELCLKLNLINEDGFFFLDQCRDVRNNFSAAHPTLGKVNDREFVTFLNRCTKYALGHSSSPRGVDLGAFIGAVKGTRFTEAQTKIWIERLVATHDAQRQLLIGTVHGIYCDPATAEPARLNALDVCASLIDRFTSVIRSDLINKHSEYQAKGDEKRHAASAQFFEKLGLISLLNESERHAVFSKATERLRIAHQEFNNFYNEPPFADRLLELSRQGGIPETAQDEYVKTVIGCYIGNGYGVSRAAEPAYAEMIRGFSPREIAIMIRSASADPVLKAKLSLATCRKRFVQALGLIESASVPSGVRADYDAYLKHK